MKSLVLGVIGLLAVGAAAPAAAASTRPSGGFSTYSMGRAIVPVLFQCSLTHSGTATARPGPRTGTTAQISRRPRKMRDKSSISGSSRYPAVLLRVLHLGDCLHGRIRYIGGDFLGSLGGSR